MFREIFRRFKCIALYRSFGVLGVKLKGFDITSFLDESKIVV